MSKTDDKWKKEIHRLVIKKNITNTSMICSILFYKGYEFGRDWKKVIQKEVTRAKQIEALNETKND